MKYKSIKTGLVAIVFILNLNWVYSKEISLESPNKKVHVTLTCEQENNIGKWYIKVGYLDNKRVSEIIPKIDLGLSRSDQDFLAQLKLLKTGKQQQINEHYTALHGKRSICDNAANEITLFFENPDKAKLNLVVRAYNDGLAFRYVFPENEGSYVINDEMTAYSIPDSTDRWLEKFDLSNEGLYKNMIDGSVQENWCYPALFKTKENSCWYLIHEADVDRNYCATKLSNLDKSPEYKVTIPYQHEGEGEAKPTITLPWKSPWRVIIIGQLADIVESTLIDDVSTPCVLENTEWIKPGLVSWNYWSNNHGTKDFQTVCEFADLAAAMDWPYTLLDWEWDAMGNGGNVEDAAKYILSKGVKPLLWYNSSMFKWIRATPVDRMKTHESRVKEFTWLKETGFAGVKVDFFLSEKQFMIDYYLDILEDAAKFEMLVYFHGCLVPRGWARTYPNLVTYEAVRGAEWYNNGPDLTPAAPEHNTILPFTRNVVGSMDYTPVTFTNSQYPHITSYGHELALSVVFESALQHMADRPEGYYKLPDAAISFLKKVPASWDNTKLLDGYPGRNVVLARQKNDSWFIGGLNAENREKRQNIGFSFLPSGKQYKLTLISDGEHDQDFNTQYMVIDQSSSIEVKMLRRGGFVIYLSPLEYDEKLNELIRQ